MKVLEKLLMSLSALLILNACNPSTSEIVRETAYVEREIPVQPRPPGVQLSDVEWIVVNAENVDEFASRFEDTDTVFVATTVQGYENLSVNLAELRRYIEQQQQLIVYYESAIIGDPEN